MEIYGDWTFYIGSNLIVSNLLSKTETIPIYLYKISF